MSIKLIPLKFWKSIKHILVSQPLNFLLEEFAEIEEVLLLANEAFQGFGLGHQSKRRLVRKTTWNQLIRRVSLGLVQDQVRGSAQSEER